MLLVAEQQLPDPPASIPSPAATTTKPAEPVLNPELIHRAAWRAGVLGALNFAAQILAVRVILLVATGGAIALAWLAASEHDPYRLAAVGVYCLTVVIPLIWLAGRR